jgi:quinolinate synthase
MTTRRKPPRYQPPLPEKYLRAGSDELRRRAIERKAQLGADLRILGHHYQNDEVFDLADFTGDSLRLSQLAAQQHEARYIVFCGVHFMAESADVLSSPEQAVILPNMRAGCNMADMADADGVAAAMDELSAMSGGARIVPITYVNSSAAIKALTGRSGGACCTSSNVRNVFEWALASSEAGGAGAKSKKILCVPDQHLGRNTAAAMGYGDDACVVYDPALPSGGISPEAAARATFFLWKGFCYVHRRFAPADVESVRRRHPGIRVIVHPECPREVVRLADASGSTEQIIRAVEQAPEGSKWAIGTESSLVNRLARRHPDRFIRVLSDAPALCQTMHFIDLPHLLWVLDNLAEGRVVNQVTVEPEETAGARVALDRMIAIKAVREVTEGGGKRK